ncbi:MFS transporter [uncultured Psychrobacter sp.]|uniref:MFS transporter n=1 Tax=uncultured Psychrobacter sp. TaxID=259303 RepID=UPI002632FEF8|nr:MFS transporter [uncultured Psychrobacter sp.]
MKSPAITSPLSTTQKQPWKLAFFFCFLVLLCDGADIGILAFTLSSLKLEFGLTNVQAGALGSWSLLGMAIGGFFGGWACDRFGRVRVIVIATATFSLLSGFSGFVQSYQQFAVLRFVACLGLGSLYIATNTLMSEMVPTKHRTTVLALLMTGFTLGSLVITSISAWIIPIYGWRTLYLLTFLPIILSIAMYLLIPEPISWQEARALKLKGLSTTITKRENPYKAILEDPKHRLTFILWTMSSGFLLFGYFGVSNWLPSYLETELGIKFKEMAIYMAGTYLTMMFAKLIAGIVADKIGRKIVFAFGTMGTALFIPVLVYMHTPENIGWMMIAFGFLYGIPYAVNATYLTESFPTAIRGTAIGGAFNIGRLGSVIAPVAIGYMAMQNSIGAGLLLMAGAYFLCGLIPTLFIKEKQYDPQKA